MKFFFGNPNRPTQQLSVHQVEQLRAAFGRLDVNSDGAISKDEIMGALGREADLAELLGMSPQLSADERFFQAGVIFQDMDTDHGGDVDVDEFIAFFGVAPGANDEEAPEETIIPKTDVETGAASEKSQSEAADTGVAETLTSRLGNFLGLAPTEVTVPEPELEPKPQSATDDEEDPEDAEEEEGESATPAAALPARP